MLRANQQYPLHGAKWLPRDMVGNILTFGNVLWVDGSNGSDSNDGLDAANAYATIQGAIDDASRGDVILVRPKAMASGATDPTDYAENLTIGAALDGLSIIGVPSNRTQGGLPQLKKGSGSTAHITIRAPGVTIANLGINGASNTGGGILLDDDASTKTAFGTAIIGCHFKNCKGSAAATTGGAIMWSSLGGAWQVLIKDCLFYNNRAGIVLPGTSTSRPQDVVIEGCTFHSNANTTVDADIYLAGGSGVDGVTIKDCFFSTVDVPAYATSPDAARYLDLTGCEGMMANCFFACITNVSATEITFGASGTGAKIPTTVRMAGCWGEPSSNGTNEHGQVFRT